MMDPASPRVNRRQREIDAGSSLARGLDATTPSATIRHASHVADLTLAANLVIHAFEGLLDPRTCIE
jgi:hypothetical protein